MSSEQSIGKKLSLVADAAEPLMTLIDDGDVDGAAVDVLHEIGRVLEAANWAIAHEAGRVLAGYERTSARDILVQERMPTEDFAERLAYIDKLLEFDADLATNTNEFERIGLDFLTELGEGRSSRTPSEVRNVLIEVLVRLNATANNPLLSILIQSLRALNLGQCQDLVTPLPCSKIRPRRLASQTLHMRKTVTLGGKILLAADIVDSAQEFFVQIAEDLGIEADAVRKWELQQRYLLGDKEFDFKVSFLLQKLENDRSREAVLSLFSLEELKRLARPFYSKR